MRGKRARVLSGKLSPSSRPLYGYQWADEERARYAPRAGVDGDLPGAVRAVRHGLRGEAGRRRRWRATLLPPSTVRAARAGSTARAESASSTLNRLGESLRRPVTPRRR